MDKPIDRSVFEYEITVMPEHLDQQQHVNNVVYVQFMQEIADKHWDSVVADESENAVAWVVRRHEIDYLNQAVLHDRLLIRTWTGEHSTVSWNRYCEIIRITDQKKIISSKSIWVLTDRLTGRPKRINEKMLRRFN